MNFDEIVKEQLLRGRNLLDAQKKAFEVILNLLDEIKNDIKELKEDLKNGVY